MHCTSTRRRKVKNQLNYSILIMLSAIIVIIALMFRGVEDLVENPPEVTITHVERPVSTNPMGKRLRAQAAEAKNLEKLNSELKTNIDAYEHIPMVIVPEEERPEKPVNPVRSQVKAQMAVAQKPVVPVVEVSMPQPQEQVQVPVDTVQPVEMPAEELLQVAVPQQVITVTATAYCPCAKCCGKTDGITASGAVATQGRTIAAGKTYAFGTQMYIPALGNTYVVEDRGGAIGDSRIDVFFDSHQDALVFGKQKLEVWVY